MWHPETGFHRDQSTKQVNSFWWEMNTSSPRHWGVVQFVLDNWLIMNNRRGDWPQAMRGVSFCLWTWLTRQLFRKMLAPVSKEKLRHTYCSSENKNRDTQDTVGWNMNMFDALHRRESFYPLISARTRCEMRKNNLNIYKMWQNKENKFSGGI